MKFIFKSIATICFTAAVMLVGTAASLAQVQAPDPTDQIQEITVKLDKYGDATWEFSEKMNQAQWESFKSGPLVNDPSISKRNMERSMSTYVIEDFGRDIDDMNRTVKMKFKVKAMATYDGGGKWELKLDSKNPQSTKLSDNSYMLTSNLYSGNQLIQQIFKVFFPDGASNIQQQTDSFGKAIFTYSKGGGIASYLSWNNLLGIILIIAAVVLFVRQQQSPQPPPPQQITTA